MAWKDFFLGGMCCVLSLPCLFVGFLVVVGIIGAFDEWSRNR